MTASIDRFFTSWTAEMAYVLGYFAADGSMYKNSQGSCYIAFTSTDLELIQLVKQLIGVTNKIEVYQSKHLSWKTRYTLQLSSKQTFNKFLALGFTPAKSLTLQLPNIPTEFFCHFVRGYFDGDGCAYFREYFRKTRPGKIKMLSINICSGSKMFLQSLQQALLQTGYIGKGSFYFHSRAYRLAYTGKDVIKLHKFLYPNTLVPCLKRKRIKIEEGIKFFGAVAQLVERFPVTE